MTKEEFKEIILAYVRTNPGVKGVALVVGVAQQCQADWTHYNNIIAILEELVSEGALREEEYTDPDWDYKVKSRYYTN